jgi:hypothetical protein
MCYCGVYRGPATDRHTRMATCSYLTNTYTRTTNCRRNHARAWPLPWTCMDRQLASLLSHEDIMAHARARTEGLKISRKSAVDGEPARQHPANLGGWSRLRRAIAAGGRRRYQPLVQPWCGRPQTLRVIVHLIVASSDATPRLRLGEGDMKGSPSMLPVAESLAVGEPRVIRTSPSAHLVSCCGGVRDRHVWPWVRIGEP